MTIALIPKILTLTVPASMIIDEAVMVGADLQRSIVVEVKKITICVNTTNRQ